MTNEVLNLSRTKCMYLHHYPRDSFSLVAWYVLATVELDVIRRVLGRSIFASYDHLIFASIGLCTTK